MNALTVSVLGVGLLGPGLGSWSSARPVLAADEPYAHAPAVIAPPSRLPPAERRRAGTAIKLALAVADEACTLASVEPRHLATVFTSSSGDGANCHALCEMLAGPDRLISPTRFTNSVHNAAAGYWHIAVAGGARSTSVCAHDASFGAGLVEAVTQVHAHAGGLLLVASDTPYPEPLHATRPLPDSFGVAMVLGPCDAPHAMARLSVRPEVSATAASTPCVTPDLETLRLRIPAARALPLLEALAAGRAADLVLDYQPALRVRVEITPL